MRRIFFSLTSLLLGALISLALCEAALRTRNPFAPRLKGDRIVLPINRRYLHDNPPTPKLQRQVVHTKNSLGFRGPEPPDDWNAALTVIAVGGSTAECRALGDGEDWPALMAARLAGDFPTLWVNNAGLAGHSTFGHLHLMDQHVAALRPKVILYLVGVNDVGLETLRSFDAVNVRSGLDWSSAKAFVESSARYSEVMATALSAYRSYLGYDRGGAFKLADLNETATTAPDQESALIAEHRKRFLPGFRDRLSRLVAAAREIGAVPVLLTQPAIYGPADDPTTGASLADVAVGVDFNGRAAWTLLELYNDVTRDVARRQGVDWIDLAASLEKDSALYYDLIHYSRKGSRRVAEIVAKELQPILQRVSPKGRFRTVLCTYHRSAISVWPLR